MSEGPSNPDDIIFEPLNGEGKPQPVPPQQEPAPPAAVPQQPAPAPDPPHAVQAGGEIRAAVLHRDRRGRIVGDRFAALCPGEEALIQAVVTLSQQLSLSGVRCWTAGTWHLLEASGEGLAPELLSARLDAALDAFRLAALRSVREAGPHEVRLYVGGRGLFVPYTGRTAGWDIGGDLPAAEPASPRLLGPDDDAATAPWSEDDASHLLPRIAPGRRLREASGVDWLLVSERIFPALFNWIREAGRESSFALLRSDDRQDGLVLLHVEGLRASDRKLFAGLPEVDLLWDPLAEAFEGPRAADQAPPVLVDHRHELPVDLAAAAFLTDAGRPVIFRAAGPPLVLDGAVPLTPGRALLRPQLLPAPQHLQPSLAPTPSLHLPLRLVRRAAEATRRTRALLLTSGDLEDLALLRDHLPWAVTRQAQIAQFADVSFVVVGEDVVWNLPIGLPFWGDDAAGVYLVRGWAPSPEVPGDVLRRAVAAADGEVIFLSPARLWCVPQPAFQPLAERIELRRDLSRVRLAVEPARFEERPVLPALEWPKVAKRPEPGPEPVLRGPEPPATRSRLLAEARAAAAGGEHEKAAVLFERAGEFLEAAQIYDRLLAEGTAP